MDSNLGQYYALEDDESIVEGVTTIVATAANVDMRDLPSLYEVIDPDCLEALFESESDDIRVTFQYAGYNVVVNANGRVAIARDSDGSERPLGECTHCGGEFDLDVDYPVMTRQTDDKVSYFAFCNTACKRDWKSQRRATTDNDG